MQLQYFPGKSEWVGGGWLNQGDLPIQIMDKSTFSNRKLLIQGIERLTSLMADWLICYCECNEFHSKDC